MSRVARGHILNILMQKSKTLQETISISTTRKNMVDGLIQIMNPKTYVAFTSQAEGHDVEKVSETSGENEEHANSEDGEDVEY